MTDEQLTKRTYVLVTQGRDGRSINILDEMPIESLRDGSLEYKPITKEEAVKYGTAIIRMGCSISATL